MRCRGRGRHDVLLEETDSAERDGGIDRPRSWLEAERCSRHEACTGRSHGPLNEQRSRDVRLNLNGVDTDFALRVYVQHVHVADVDGDAAVHRDEIATYSRGAKFAVA